MADVLHCISFPVLVYPYAPAGLQKAPGWTPFWVDDVVGLVVRGALVVRFGVGLGLLRVGFGAGLGRLVVAVGLGDPVVGATLGDSVEGRGLSGWETAGSASARAAAADSLAAGLSSPELPTAARPPPQQQSRTSPRTPPAIFCPRVTRRFGPLPGAPLTPTGTVAQPCTSCRPAAEVCAVGRGGTGPNWAVGCHGEGGGGGGGGTGCQGSCGGW
ncbi:hypothetical protein [Micromonospora sp. NPDC047738]|uniref:hypothetical protein n=1 Tax=unclassified Micromonospora TaxID=2617518 RepID=UPI00340C74EB